MASINNGLNIDSNSWKYSNRKKSTNYTARDYQSAKDELLKIRDDLTEKWTSTDEADPGVILIKEMAQAIDILSYNQDKQILECFPNSVTQLKNARQLYGLIGYKMKWYRSATCKVNIVNTYEESATLPRFSQFSTIDKSIVYVNWNQLELPSNTTNNGLEVSVDLIQGVVSGPTKKSGYYVPAANKPWHDIYNYNIQASSIVDRKINIATKEIDQDHICLVDDNNVEWTQVDSVATQTEVGHFFELRIDEYNQPYLFLVDYWENFNISAFKLFYLISSGEDGQIQQDALQQLITPAYVVTGVAENQKVTNVSSYIKFTNYESSWGYDPETPDEAREEATKYINTADTIVTLDDATRFCSRLDGVANCLATDVTNDPGTIYETYYGDLNHDGSVDSLDRELLYEYLTDSYKYALTTAQMKLADLNNDGKVTQEDLDLFDAFLAGDIEHCGRCGQPARVADPLPNFTCKLYITRTSDFDSYDIPSYYEYIKTQFESTRHICLTFVPDVEHIEYYYWTIKGTLYLKSPQTLKVANDILVRINRQLNFDFRPEVMRYNERVKFIDVVHSIENKVDDLIDHVDLDPIEYMTDEGEVIENNLVTGEFSLAITAENKNEYIREGTNNLEYLITLPQYPIRPNFLSISIEGGDIVLKDNGNGKIGNEEQILQESGKVDYAEGIIRLKFNREIDKLNITYSRNQITMARYTNLSTLTFNISADSLKSTKY